MANENLPIQVIEALRAQKHDVVWARSEMPGAKEEAVLARAQEEEPVLLTQDKDFGDAAFRWGLPSSCGIVLIRMSLPGS